MSRMLPALRRLSLDDERPPPPTRRPIRVAWAETIARPRVSDAPRTNLNIFLAHGTVDDADENTLESGIVTPTAAARRERFQRRANPAFSLTVRELAAPPPLLRSSSAPCKSDRRRPKFPRRKLRIKKKDEQIGEFSNVAAVTGTDVVTMVSLISPSGTDEEDEIGNCDRGQQKRLNGRKTGGTDEISFQQSSIHAIRSFSASFPGRRTPLIGSDSKSNPLKIQEKRVARHLENRQRMQRNVEKSLDEDITPNETNKLDYCERRGVGNEANGSRQEQNATLTETEQKNKIKEKFFSSKEKQCWEMYRKMSNKGINISYDTILRGMLTPTEYRLRNKNNDVDHSKND